MHKKGKFDPSSKQGYADVDCVCGHRLRYTVPIIKITDAGVMYLVTPKGLIITRPSIAVTVVQPLPEQICGEEAEEAEKARVTRDLLGRDVSERGQGEDG